MLHMNVQCRYKARVNLDNSCLVWRPISQHSLRLGESPSQHILFHFMSHWTCSRCWKTVVRLAHQAQRLHGHDIAYVLVGPDHYLIQARQFAADLGLCITILSDDDQMLSRAYGLEVGDVTPHGQSLALIDTQGVIRYQATDPSTVDVTHLENFLQLFIPHRWS
jgi:peroxiredoxin